MQSFLSEDRYSPTHNWLVLSKSPYLKEHERSPVNWLEWTPEAFDKAYREGKLVFIHMGEIHCHLCEAMTQDAFEDMNLAKQLNDKCICIMVDKNEQPDIASMYLDKCQKIEIEHKGKGPLNIFLTYEQIPLYAGRNLPLESTDDVVGFKELVTQLYDQFVKCRG